MTKDQATIKKLTKEVDDLTTQLNSVKSTLESVTKTRDDYYNQILQLHRTFDLMNVPGKVEQGYYSRDLDVQSRLTLLVTMIGLNASVKLSENKKEG